MVEYMSSNLRPTKKKIFFWSPFKESSRDSHSGNWMLDPRSDIYLLFETHWPIGLHQNYKICISKDTVKKAKRQSQVWWSTPVMPALRRLRQEGVEFEAILSYIMRTWLKNTRTKQNNNNEQVSWVRCATPIIPSYVGVTGRKVMSPRPVRAKKHKILSEKITEKQKDLGV
jgi:hypothetical protein